MTKRSYRWLLLSLAVVGLTADQITKYKVFRWLYHGRQPSQVATADGQLKDGPDGAFAAWTFAPPWVVKDNDPRPQYLPGGRYDVVPGWFGLIAQYNPPRRTLPDGTILIDRKSVRMFFTRFGRDADVAALKDEELEKIDRTSVTEFIARFGRDADVAALKDEELGKIDRKSVRMFFTRFGRDADVAALKDEELEKIDRTSVTEFIAHFGRDVNVNTLADDDLIVLPTDSAGKPIKPWRYDLQTWSAPRLPHVNRGALFGMGANQDGSAEAEQQAENANTLFAVVSLIASGGIAVWAVLRGQRADAWICAALGLILGGTVGNLFDRVVFHGVRDFLFFYKTDFPVFNVADSCLVCGAIMLVLHALFVKHPNPPATIPASAVAPVQATAATPTTV